MAPKKSAPPKATRKSLDDVPWASVRRDFETTDVSVRELAVRYGIPSENSIRRRIERDGWARDTSAVSATLVTRAVAGMRDEIPHLSTPILDQPALEAPIAAGNAPIGAAEGCAQAAHSAHTGAHTPVPVAQETAENCGSAPSSVRRNRRALADEADAIQLSTAKGLAEIHERSTRRQLRIGEKLQRLADTLVDALGDLMTGGVLPGGGSFADVDANAAATRLTSINPDKETLAGLLKAVDALTERGIAIERRALGMDPKTKADAAPGTSAASVNTQALLSRFPSEVLLQMRQVAQDIHRRPVAPAPALEPATIEGEQA